MSWCACCILSCLVDGRGPVSVSVWGYDLLWLCWWNGASLQPCRPALRLHAAAAAPPRLWRLGHHGGQVRESSGVTRSLFGRDPLQDQILSIYSACCPVAVLKKKYLATLAATPVFYSLINKYMKSCGSSECKWMQQERSHERTQDW